MASNILSGDRRWASGRKSGMTILGKVPKPINLPSQRSENNGLDPNVEIVPKGTLSWGSRSSSSTSNVWSSSTLLSPKTDGGTGSPSHYNSRPSSGGSGTRPSTAGSDKSLDSQNAWGSNSHPSTASGLSPSHQAPVLASRPRSAETRPIIAARPRSAETRPGSSQLSRFAENVPEPAVAWGSTKTADKLGIASSINHEFSLSSGDFPTLGSEKGNEMHGQQAGQTFQEHTDASSGPLRSNESLKSPRGEDACMDQEDASAPRTGRETSYGVAASHNQELHNNSQQAQPLKSAKLTPTQFDSWHGPGIHAPDKVLYRGALVGPYGLAGPPGGFPVESCVCYPHPLPSNSEAVPRPGAGSVQYQSSSGDVYRPQVLPNSYMFSSHPVIPAIPGPYPTPVPYDGCYSYHQASFCTSGEQQMPSTRVATQPSFFKNPKSNSSITSDEYRNNLGRDFTKRTEVQVLSNRARAPFQGPYKVLLKQQGDIANNAPQVKVHSGTLSPNTTQCHVEKPKESISKESELSPGCQKNDIVNDMNLEIDHQASLKVAVDGMGQPSNPVISGLGENSRRTSEGILKREPTVAIRGIHDWKHNTASRTNTSLIGKIEDLNNKVRSAENHSIIGELLSKQERLKQPKVANARSEHSVKARSTSIPVSLDMHATDSTVVSRQSDSDLIPIEAGSHVSKGTHSTPGRGEYHSNSMLDYQTDGGRTRELSEKDPSVVLTEKNTTEDAYSDLLDHKNQRAKTKELAGQRAKQLQREEERMRDQKAKSLAKLEELNRHSATSTKPKSNEASSSGHILHQPEDAGVDAASNVTLFTADIPLQANNDEYNNVGPVVSLPPNSVSHTPETVAQDSSAIMPTLSMEHHTNTTAVAAQDTSQSNASSGSKHRQMGHRRRQKFSMEKNTGEKSMRDDAGSKHLDEALYQNRSNEKQFTGEKKESPQKFVEVNAPASSVDMLPHNGDSSLHQKKKNNRNWRNKNRDDTLFGSSLTTHSNVKIEEYPSQSPKTIPAPPDMETSPVPAIISADHSSGQESGDGIVNSQGSSKVDDEIQGRMSSHWRPHPFRKTARNYQSVRPTDKVHGSETVIRAPVRPANKIEQSEEIKQNSTMGNNSDSSQQIGHDISGTKTKRAEMERYVPKPVAKEHLQQENNQKSSTHDNQMAFDDMHEKPHLDSKVVGLCKIDGSSDFGVETKKAEENRPGRRGRVHASWRQRSSADSALPSQTPNENVQPPDGTKIFNKPSNQHLPLPEQVKSDDRENYDKFMQKNSDVVSALTKDQGMRSKQKHHQTHRVTGSNYGISEDQNFKNETNDKNGDSHLNLDTSENDVKNCINDPRKHAVGEHVKSHSRWKPKSQISHPGKGTGGQRNFYHAVRVEKFSYPGTGTNYLSNEGNNTLDQKDQSRNSAPPVEQMHIRKPVGDVNGHLDGRFIREQEATYRIRDFMHTSGKSNGQRIDDQRRSTPYFEYQPVDPYRKQSDTYHRSNSNTDQEPQRHHASRQSYKEHHHTQTRNHRRFIRGATTAHVDSNNGEE
ncbi:protein MODIFIER OF SNC1 1-like isoform X1 [Zingiber officinale]|uniref:protein MODIFIER OF SNC1 1-like isoform X1 n=2 Tax=Zingiber officinale TaxID=94328 RepID=UPI001C4BE22B|nr:protein MODIFIER OF SNC1 1-like isoform X1 [Zingiber officinale]XP_042447037.1 protein MODIFIER OF SNC1 1-like isoform X1 [Zingiber officinale]XP_042447038.1 protein MODIFIER OF SNC1 1-like isoform X1 [Zingiber officinale]XP_042447041.1 protein MODIFIER OF SNC1 1-like isoform X1 [Zingiber officinale]